MPLSVLIFRSHCLVPVMSSRIRGCVGTTGSNWLPGGYLRVPAEARQTILARAKGLFQVPELTSVLGSQPDCTGHPGSAADCRGDTLDVGAWPASQSACLQLGSLLNKPLAVNRLGGALDHLLTCLRSCGASHLPPFVLCAMETVKFYPGLWDGVNYYL